jgi:hypothetical protein
MRYPGENSAGRAPGRRQGPSGRTSQPEERAAGGPASGRRPARGDPSLFAPGYSADRPAAREPVPAGGGRYGAGGGAAGKGPIRGFPPGPGQPPPVYPPGPFSAWNRAPAEAGNGYDLPGGDAWLADGMAGEAEYPPSGAGAGYADTGYADTGYSDAGYGDAGYGDAGYGEPGPPAAAEPFAEPGHPEPGYSALAVSDPAADVTSTQGWDVVDESAPASRWPDLAGGDDRWPQAPGATATPPAGLARPDPGRPGERADPGPAGGPPGPFDRAAPAPFDRGAAGPDTRVTTGPGQRVPAGTGPGRAAAGGRRGTRARTRPGGRGQRLRTLVICGLALIVAAGAASYFVLARGGSRPTAAEGGQRPRARPSTDPSPTPSLGPWGHIASRALDPAPLTLTELFPAQFTNAGVTYVMTVDKAKTHCGPALVGSQLVSAVSAADCTQAMRASYLSTNRKVMGTIGVLNLVTAAAAEKAGQAAGPTEFIAQLPAAHGLTRFLTRGTGIEAAEVKGHYLVLVWAELGTTHAPATAAQRTELTGFISLLMQQTANISLASRMITGTPAAP